MWHEILHSVLKGVLVVKEIAFWLSVLNSMFSFVKNVNAVKEWAVKQVEDLKNILCFYNEISVPKMKLVM